MTRDWLDRPIPRMPTWDDIDRHTDDAYEVAKQRQLDAEAETERCAKHADRRIVIPAKDATNG